MEYPVSHDAIKVSLLFENALCHPLVMFRKESIDERYNESYVASQDYELWSRLIWKKNFYNMNSVLLKYRVHKNQTKNVVGRKQKEGAIAARHEMLKHLVDNADPVFLATFDKMFLVGQKFSKKTIDEIESVLKKIIELNKIAGEPIDVLVNGKFVAKGEVVVIEESFGIRVTEIIKE